MKVLIELEVGESDCSHFQDLLWDDIQLALKSYAFELLSLEVQREGVAVAEITDPARLLTAAPPQKLASI